MARQVRSDRLSWTLCDLKNGLHKRDAKSSRGGGRVSSAFLPFSCAVNDVAKSDTITNLRVTIFFWFNFHSAPTSIRKMIAKMGPIFTRKEIKNNNKKNSTSLYLEGGRNLSTHRTGIESISNAPIRSTSASISLSTPFLVARSSSRSFIRRRTSPSGINLIARRTTTNEKRGGGGSMKEYK